MVMRWFGARKCAVAAFAAGLSILVVPAAVGADEPTLTFTNVSCTPAGYSFTANGTGFAPGSTLIVHVYDTVFPYSPGAFGSPWLSVADGGGSFGANVSESAGERLPATVTVTDPTGASMLAGPFTVDGPCGPPPPSGLMSTIGVGSSSIPADGTATTTITVQARDATGANETIGGAAVALWTTLGRLGPVTDLGNGTYTATLTASMTPGSATIYGSINAEPIPSPVTVTLAVPPIATVKDSWNDPSGFVFKNKGDAVSFASTYSKKNTNQPG